MFGLLALPALAGKVLDFLRSPLGLVVIGGLLFLGGVIYEHRRMAARFEAEKQQSIEAARQIDEKAAAEARERMTQQTREAQTRVRQVEEQIDEYAKMAAACTIGSDDSNFLNGLGLRGDNLQGAVPVPPARPNRGR